MSLSWNTNGHISFVYRFVNKDSANEMKCSPCSQSNSSTGGDEVRSGVKVVGSRLLKTPQAEKCPITGSAWGERSAAGDARVPRPALHLKVESLKCSHWQLALTPTCRRGNKKRVGGLKWSIHVCVCVCSISLIGLSQEVTSVPAGSQCVCDYHMSQAHWQRFGLLRQADSLFHYWVSDTHKYASNSTPTAIHRLERTNSFTFINLADAYKWNEGLNASDYNANYSSYGDSNTYTHK